MNRSKIFFTAAAGLLMSPALMAADLDGPSTNFIYTDELLSLADADDMVASGNLAVTLGAEYAVGDIVDLTFTGNALDDTSPNTSVVTPCVAGVAGPPATGKAGITFGLLSATDGSARYRVTEIDSATCAFATSTVGQTVIFSSGDLMFNAQAVDTNNGVTASFSAMTGTGLPLDTGGALLRSHDHIVTGNQIAYQVNLAFDAVIDVNADRKVLIPPPSDTASWGLAPTAFPPFDSGFGIAFVDADAVWSGDFSWIIDTDENTADIQPVGGVVQVPGCDATPVTSLVITATSISANCSSFGGSLILDPSLNVDGAGLRVLPAGPFTAEIASNFTDGLFWGDATPRAATETVSGVDVGEWALNGFQALLSYTPFGDNIGQVIYLANRGMQAGDVTVDYVAQDGSFGSLGVVATVQPNSTLSIGPKIRDALPPALQAFGRIALTITANIPACDGQINAQYNASGNRAYTSARDNCSVSGGSF